MQHNKQKLWRWIDVTAAWKHNIQQQDVRSYSLATSKRLLEYSLKSIVVNWSISNYSRSLVIIVIIVVVSARRICDCRCWVNVCCQDNSTSFRRILMNFLQWCDMWLATKDLILVMSRIKEFFNEILPLQDGGGGAISRIRLRRRFCSLRVITKMSKLNFDDLLLNARSTYTVPLGHR